MGLALLRPTHHLLTTGLRLVMAGILLTACTVIDDDLSDCEKDLHIHYQAVLRTNLTEQVERVLRQRGETAVADLVERSLADHFRPWAYDADLTFFDADGPQSHETFAMNAAEADRDLSLPTGSYRHLVVANMAHEGTVTLAQGQQPDATVLTQPLGDLIGGHGGSLFTARRDLLLEGQGEERIDVTLYMANSGNVLVVRTDSVSYRSIRVETSDVADAFRVSDSTYTFSAAQRISDARLTDGVPAEREVFTALTFPSHDTAAESRADDHQMGSDDADRIWHKTAYVEMPDGTVTRTQINVRVPLEAGQVYIIYAIMAPDGSLHSYNPEVATSVTLDWKEGLVF